MKKILSLSLLFLFATAHGQATWLNVKEFYTSVSREANKPQPLDCKRIRLEEWDQAIFATKQAEMALPSSGNWKILFEYKVEWSWMVGEKIKPLKLWEKNPFVSPDCGKPRRKVYTAHELTDGFNLEASLEEYVSGKLGQYPYIKDRHAPMNGIWTSILAGDFLILRYVNAYPNGNQTSSFFESRLYFYRID